MLREELITSCSKFSCSEIKAHVGGGRPRRCCCAPTASIHSWLGLGAPARTCFAASESEFGLATNSKYWMEVSRSNQKRTPTENLQ